MKLTERRSAPRFEVSLDGTAKTNEGHLSEIKVSNISSSGLQFSIAQHEVPQIFPNPDLNNSLDPIHLELKIELPESHSSGATNLSIKVGIVYLKRVGIDLCVAGCRFEHFESDALVILENYIQHLNDPEIKLLE